jgi:hypothetical protein
VFVEQASPVKNENCLELPDFSTPHQIFFFFFLNEKFIRKTFKFVCPPPTCTCGKHSPLMLMGGRADDLTCADSGARNPNPSVYVEYLILQFQFSDLTLIISRMFHICQSKCFCASLPGEGGGRGREKVLYCFGEVRWRKEKLLEFVLHVGSIARPDHQGGRR